MIAAGVNTEDAAAHPFAGSTTKGANAKAAVGGHLRARAMNSSLGMGQNDLDERVDVVKHYL